VGVKRSNDGKKKGEEEVLICIFSH